MVHPEPSAEQGEQVAREFADDPLACEHDWQRPFELARRLQGLGPATPEQHREAVRLYCDLTGTPFLDFWSDFIDDWPKVRFPATGEDAFAWAAQRAEREPVSMPREPPAQEYGFVGSMAWHLACRNPTESFFLPTPRLAKLLGCRGTTISNILKWLKANGVIECVDENYSWGRGKGKCKLYCIAQPEQDGPMRTKDT